MSKPVHSLLNVNSTPETPIKPVVMPRADGDEPWENINFFALKEEILFLYSVSRFGKSDKWLGVCGHFNLRRKLEIELYGADIRKIEAEYSIQIPDTHEFAEPVEFIPHQFVGRKFRKIGQLISTTFKDTVQTALPEPEPVADTAPLRPPHDNESVTVIAVMPVERGYKSEWKIEARTDDGTLLRFPAYSEHDWTIQAAGYQPLPARGIMRQTRSIEVVIEYSDKYEGYRISHVYHKDTSKLVSVADGIKAYEESRKLKAQPDTTPDIVPDIQPALAVVSKPERVVIPVAIEYTLEEQIAALYRKRDYTVAGILELVADAVKPSKPILVSMVADDKTTEIPAYPEIMAAGDTSESVEGMVA